MTRPADFHTDMINIIEGTIVGRRSMGRKLAFADIALASSTTSGDDFTCNLDGDYAPMFMLSSSTHNDIDGPSIIIKAKFRIQTFLGSDTESSYEQNDNENNETTTHSNAHIALIMNEPFPVKEAHLSYGAKVILQLYNTLSKDTNGNIQENTYEVIRWKIKEHPRELAEHLASLDLERNNKTNKMVVSTNNIYVQEQEEESMILGSGAMSCSTYFKARGDAFESAKQHRIRMTGIVDGNNNLCEKPRRERQTTTDIEGCSNVSTTTDVHTQQHNTVSNPGNNTIDFSDCHHGGKQAKAKRAKVFASWAFDTFFGIPIGSLVDSAMTQITICQPCSITSDASNKIIKNAHIVDIAGGKGGLSVELIVQQMYHLGSSLDDEDTKKPVSHCTIIDPLVRKSDAKQRQSRLKKSRSHVEWLQRQMQEQDQIEYTNNGKEIIANTPIQHLAMNFDASSFAQLYVQEDQSGSNQSTSPMLLLGLHPDECTEEIVDVALEHNLSFAIVPCCVFPDQFPSRRMISKEKPMNDDGEPNLVSVRSYKDFLQYLMAKDDAIKRATLPFEGKNIVLYKIVVS